MQKIKFIHTADLHLGSTLNYGGNCPDKICRHFNSALYNSFSKIVDFAIDEKVDFILISGDLYDQESRSVKANVFFKEQCQRLDKYGINIYLIAGNHDPINKYRQLFDLPDNVYLFDCDKPEIKEVYSNDELIAAVSGCSYSRRAESRKMHQDYQYIAGVLNIALLHTQLDNKNNNYVPANLNELLEIRDIHYWALGHIHKNNILYSDINKAVAYSGNPQGRHMGEDGVKGFYLVELNSNRSPEIEFIPTSSIIYQQIEIPIDSIRDGNITDLQNLITDISKELLRNRFYLDTRGNIHIKGYVVEWVLIGRGIIYDIFKEQEDEIIPHLIAQLRQELIDFTPFIWTKSIINRTSPLINEKELYNSIVFQDINKITDLLKEKETLRDELLKELGLIWTSSLDHEEIDYFKFSLDDETLKTILELSRQYIIEELIERRKLS